jgi:XRE family transcriptional regulator, aerobic/anaerobic benzoate catabolism transcriptional regulator
MSDARAGRENELLRSVGERVRELRRARGSSQLDLASKSGLSVRFLSQLEAGEGNISLARLSLVASALGVPLSSLVGDDDPAFLPVMEEVRKLLRERGVAEVQKALDVARAVVGGGAGVRVALLGIRGAGKTTVGNQLAKKLRVPFVELDARVEKEAGLPLSAMFEMHGEAYYRRMERQALLKLLSSTPSFVMATGGSIVTSDDEYALLQRTCHTVWLRARPEDHWERVVAQGDARPMRENPRAMDELRALFSARYPLYEKAQLVIDTPGETPESVASTIAAALVP